MSWHLPTNLEGIEQEIRENARCDVTNDFGSYAYANRVALNGSNIEAHNIVKFARVRARLYRRLFGGAGVRRIADLGCGLGYTTAALAQEFDCPVDGYDVSADAVEFASRTHRRNGLAFHAGVLDPDRQERLGDSTYDVILAQEFYPFTRTGDGDSHVAWIRFLAASLSDAGRIVIELGGRYVSPGHGDETILRNLAHIGACLPNLRVRQSRMPNVNVVGLVRSHLLSAFLCTIGEAVLKRPVFRDVVVTVTQDRPQA